MTAVAFYLLIAIFQREGARTDAFGTFVECMATRDGWIAEHALLVNTCEEVRLVPTAVEGQDDGARRH